MVGRLEPAANSSRQEVVGVDVKTDDEYPG
jgi:hypothetical protein